MCRNLPYIEKDFKTKIFVDFQRSNDTDEIDRLKIFIRKSAGEWKVESYVLEQ